MGTLLNFAGSGFTAPQIVFNIILILVLSLVIAWFYKKTHKGLSYSQSFVQTLVLMSIIVAIVMMVIGNSLARAFGLLGAFTLIRFRTVVKETKDTAFIFFALAIGMAVGTGNYLIAVLGTLLILAILWALDRTNFGSMRHHDYLLSFTVSREEGSSGSFEDIFQKYFKSTLLLNIGSRQDGAASEMTYNVSFKEATKPSEVVRALSAVPGVSNVNVITAESDTEY